MGTPQQYNGPVQARPPAPPPFYLTPPAGSRLEQLLAMRASVKAERDGADARYEEVKAAIEAEAAMLATAMAGITGPDGQPVPPADIRIAGAPGWKGMRLLWKMTRRFNGKRLTPLSSLTSIFRRARSWLDRQSI